MNKEDPSSRKLQQLPTSDTLQSSLDASELATTAPQNSALATINSSTALNNGLNSNLLPGMSSMAQNGIGSTSALGNSMYGSSMYGNSGMYGGTGMYGGSSMYGSSMYGGGMGMGMGMGGMNGNMTPPVPGQPGQFRDEYQGVLMGFNSLMNIMGAAVGMVSFGGTFVHFTKNAIVYVAKGFTNIAYRILGIAFMKRVIRWLMSSEVQRDLLKSMHRVAHAEKAGLGKKVIGKLFLVVRVLSGLAFLGMYFMHHRLTKRMREIEKNNDNIRNFDNTLGPILFDNNEAVIEERKEMEDADTVGMNCDEAAVEEVEEQMAELKEEEHLEEDGKSQIESAENLEDKEEDNLDQVSIKLDAERADIDAIGCESTEVDNAKETEELGKLEAAVEEDFEEKQMSSTEIVAKQEQEREHNETEAKGVEEAPETEENTIKAAQEEQESATVEVAKEQEQATVEVAKEEEQAAVEVAKEEEVKASDSLAQEKEETKGDKAASAEEVSPAVKTLDEAFDNIMSQEKTYVQSNQVRSEEFWKHEQPQSAESSSPAVVPSSSTANIVEEQAAAPAQQPAQIFENDIIPAVPSAVQPLYQQNNFFSGQSYPQTDLNLQTPPSFEFQNQNLQASQPSAIQQQTGVEPNIISTPLSSAMQTSQTVFSGDIQQPKIFKAVSNRAKPWLK